MDAEFPDEVDTPQDMLAKFRFQKYRGLESFRTTPWDSKENLPIDYARIFQFQNFDRTRKRILRDSEDTDGVLVSLFVAFFFFYWFTINSFLIYFYLLQPGWYITIHVKNVSQDLFKAHCNTPDRPLLVFGLLPHEQKMSVLNVILKRTGNNSKPIKSKERLVFQCGFRRFVTCPIFSQHTNGNKHKVCLYWSTFKINFLWFMMKSMKIITLKLNLYYNFSVWEILPTGKYNCGEHVCTNHVLSLSCVMLCRKNRRRTCKLLRNDLISVI